MKLRFPTSEIQAWAKRYDYGGVENKRLERELIEIAPLVQRTGRLTKDQLLKLCRWKSARNTGRVEKNDESFVHEVTAFAFSTPSRRASIEALTLLDGVAWPTASAILHLFHKEDYPILDFRALWSVKEEVPSQYCYDFWMGFTRYSRMLAKETNLTMREVDRALWQYSKVNQKG